MIQAGKGPSHVNTFLAALEVPGIQFYSMKKRQLEIAKMLKLTAQISCLDALKQEMETT